MSAIYGAIDLSGKQIDSELKNRFKQEYSKYKTDRIDDFSLENAFMGCGIQYFTYESENELLPIYDEKKQILFTADCLLDNRSSIIDYLSGFDISASAICTDSLENLPDGSLIYLMYLKYGTDCAKLLRGVFSFAVYDIENHKVVLFADQFSTRSLFFCVIDGVVYFSTLLFPLVHATGISFEKNERWLIDTLSIRGPMMITEERETAYDNIFKVDCGNYVEISSNAYDYHCYYNPVPQIKVNKKRTDEEAGKEFLSVFSKAVEVSLRTSGNVAIELSSGLDSSSVAGIAAPILQKVNKTLYSYTSVPLSGYCENDSSYIRDESDGVKLICDMYPNIKAFFTECKGKNILTEAQTIIHEWELPCKSQQNAVWIDDIFEKASKAGCKIILSGSTGNCTISMGAIDNLYYNQIITGHLIAAYKAFVNYFSKYHAQKKPYAKSFVKLFLSDPFRNIFHKVDCYEDILTRRDIGEKHNLTNRFNGKIYGYRSFQKFSQLREKMYYRTSYSQIGEINTKHSLKYGVLERDPTRNVELIELLLSFPLRMFVNENYDRRLVREYMKDIVPDEIRLNVKSRGLQSADNLLRIEEDWNNFQKAMLQTASVSELYQYIDQKKYEKMCAENNDFKSSNAFDIMLLLDLYTFALFYQIL